MTPCEARSVASTRGDCSVFGAHKMHAMRGRPEIAGRHGAGHAEAVHRPCGFMRGTGRPWPSARRSHPSGRRGTPFGFALAEVLNSLYKAELIRNRPRLDEHGPWEGIDDVELATAQWVHWYNTVRPHCAIGMRTPAEHEAARVPDTDHQEQPQPTTTGTN